MAAFYTLLYVAPSTEAESIAMDAEEDATSRYPNAWLQHVGDEELVALWDVLDSASNDGTLMGDVAYASPDGEVMVFRMSLSRPSSLLTSSKLHSDGDPQNSCKHGPRWMFLLFSKSCRRSARAPSKTVIRCSRSPACDKISYTRAQRVGTMWLDR